MIRFLLRRSILLMVVFTALTMAARALGITRPFNPALAGFSEGCQDKPQPCWHGIVPGVTPMEEAEATLIRQGYRIDRPNEGGGEAIRVTSDFQCTVILYGDHLTKEVDFFDFRGDCDLRLGDMLAFLGVPDFVSAWVVLSTIPPKLYYTHRGVVITLKSCCSTHLQDYFMYVSFYSGIYSPVSSDPYLIRWHGLILNWRYCQLEPEFKLCS
jgi:hypothetical protein